MLVIKWNDGCRWNDFDVSDINHKSRTHAISLFSGGIPVIVKEGDTYISNCKETRHAYHKKRLKIISLADCVPDERPLDECGFLG